MPRCNYWNINGTRNFFVKSKSKPLFVCLSTIDVNKISPAPKFSTFFAHSTTSIPVLTLPPLIKTSQEFPFFQRRSRLLCIDFQLKAPSVIILGSFIAELFTEILSAPTDKNIFISSTLLMPPPTVSDHIHWCSSDHINHCLFFS